MQKRWAIALLFLAATLLFYWKILLTTQYSLFAGQESINQTYSWLRFEVESLRHGSIPTWDPFAYAGHSFAGEMQTAVFYPVHWLLALVPFDKHGFVPTRALYAMFAFNHVLAGLFFYWLARELGLDRYVAFLSGLCFTFGGFVERVEWPHMLESALWTPFVFAALSRALRSGGRQRTAYAGLASFGIGISILAGGLHVVFMQALLVIGAVVFHAWGSERLPRRERWMRAGLLAVAVVGGGALLGAAQLLPSHEYAERSVRFLGSETWPAAQKIPYEMLHDRLLPVGIVSALFPTGFDGHYSAGENWPPYIGVFPFAMALIGLFSRWSSPWVRFSAYAAAVSFVYAMGAFTGLHGTAYALVPFLWMAREATRFTFVTQFALCILAAFGFEAVRSGLPDVTRQKVLRTVKWAAIIAGGAITAATLFPHLELAAWTGFSLVLVLATCGLLWRLLARPSTPGMWAPVAVFCFFDLLSFNWVGQPLGSKDGDFQAKLISMKGACEFLRSRPRPYRVTVEDAQAPNIGDTYEIPELLGGGVTLANGYGQLLDHKDLLNTKYYVKPASATDAQPIYQDANWKVFEDAKAFPRAWIVHQVAQDIATVKPDLHAVAVFSEKPRLLVEPLTSGGEEAITWKQFDGDRIELEAEPRSSGLLVLSENFYPGWAARVNGQQAPIWRVDGGLRAVEIPKGKAVVEMRWEPRSVRVGVGLSSVTLAAMVWLWMRARTGMLRGA